MDMGLDLEWQQFLNNSDSSVTPCEATAKATATARAAVKPKVKPKVKPNMRHLDEDEEGDEEGDGAMDVTDDDTPDQIDTDADNTANNTLTLTEDTRPKCTPIYVSTKTKISYLTCPIDIHAVFWNIPVLKYAVPMEGAIKKQMKFC